MTELLLQLKSNKTLSTIFVYGILLAAGTFLLQWMEYQYLLRQHSVELTVVVLCTLFSLLGIWFGLKLNRKSSSEFRCNTAIQSELSISKREMDVLNLLAAGNNTQEIADTLFISVNTVKTHLQRLYEKLDAPHRGQAVQRARDLGLVP